MLLGITTEHTISMFFIILMVLAIGWYYIHTTNKPGTLFTDTVKMPANHGDIATLLVYKGGTL